VTRSYEETNLVYRLARNMSVTDSFEELLNVGVQLDCIKRS
jgi:hypothetical protein